MQTLTNEERYQLDELLRAAIKERPDELLRILQKHKEKAVPQGPRGFYIVPPHGQLIAKGEKSHILKGSERPLGGEWVLVSGKKAYGLMTLGEPEPVSRETVLLQSDSFQVSQRDLDLWWPEAGVLYSYTVKDFRPFPHPLAVRIPPGVQTVIDTVDFLGDPGIFSGIKGGPGSGWFAPPKGTHGVGSQGGEPDIPLTKAEDVDSTALFHASRREHAEAIAEEGVQPGIGPMVEFAYGEYAGEEYGGGEGKVGVPELVFTSHDVSREVWEVEGRDRESGLEAGLYWTRLMVREQIREETGVSIDLDDLSPDDIRQHGLLIGTKLEDLYDTDLYRENHDGLMTLFRAEEADDGSYSLVPQQTGNFEYELGPMHSVEPGDLVSLEPLEPSQMIWGDELVRLFEMHGIPMGPNREKSLGIKGGPTSGWYSPPKGTHGPGSQGGEIGPFGKDRELYEKARSWAGAGPEDHPGRVYEASEKIANLLAEGGGEGTVVGYDPDTYDSITITKEQAEFLGSQLQGEAAQRLNHVKQEMGLPDTYEELLENPEASVLETPPAWREAPEGMYEGLEARMRQYSDNVSNPADIHDGEFWRIQEMYHQQAIDQYGEDSPEANAVGEWLWSARRGMKDQHEYRVRHEIALGNITPEEAAASIYGVDRPQGSKHQWESLPGTLYHVTTNSSAIQADRIRSRRELSMYLGAGLGGGESDTISFTTDLDGAKNIERSIHEAHHVARGDITIGDMLAAARAGGGGVGRPWDGVLPKAVTSVMGGNPDTIIQRLLDAEAGNPWRERDRDLRELRVDFYKSYLWARQHAGGYENPVFFSTDWEALANLDPEDFAILRYNPRSGSRGYQMGSLGEWRTVGGDTVELDAIIDWIDVGDIDALLGTGRWLEGSSD